MSDGLIDKIITVSNHSIDYHSNLYRGTKLEWTLNDTFLEFDPLIPVYTAEKHKPNQAAPHKLTFDTQLSFN